MLDRPLKLGTRCSPLAMAQAEEARARLLDAMGWHPEMIDIVGVTATGDMIQDRPLAEIGGKALWTKELDSALIGEEIDFAVHSAKDVETLRPQAITIAAVLPREDVRDVLIGAESIAALPPGARIGTSAPRRAAQLLNARPDCVIVPFRGNVATRLAKLLEREADATFLAAAGLSRLGEGDVGTPLPVGEWLPAPAQGAIAIECRTRDMETRIALKAIDHAPSHAQVRAERALLTALGGTCHSPVAVHTRFDGDDIVMTVALFSPDGQARVGSEARFARNDVQTPARLAMALLRAAPESIGAHFTGAR